MTEIHAYATQKAGEEFAPFSYEAGPCGDDEVEVAVTHCGICHSDLHLIDDDWKVSQFPLIPGHEIVGTVSAVGSRVKTLKVGDRVGIGWQCGSCLTCEQCLRGEENLCTKGQQTAIGHHGGFADRVRAHSRFVIPIPEALPSLYAAPLLCAGVTVYSPMHVGQVTPNQHVAIVGVGGLGHLALQFYNAFGCEVTAFSSSEEKRSEAEELGAHHFLSSDPKALKETASSFDLILITIPAPIDGDLYCTLLKPHGKLCFVGISELSLKAMSLISGDKQVLGSAIGSPLMIEEMLNFAARHEILPKVEKFPLSEVNRAIEKLRKNELRYRAVLEVG